MAPSYDGNVRAHIGHENCASYLLDRSPLRGANVRAREARSPAVRREAAVSPRLRELALRNPTVPVMIVLTGQPHREILSRAPRHRVGTDSGRRHPRPHQRQRPHLHAHRPRRQWLCGPQPHLLRRQHQRRATASTIAPAKPSFSTTTRSPRRYRPAPSRTRNAPSRAQHRPSRSQASTPC